MSSIHRSFALLLLGCFFGAASAAQEHHYPPGKIRGTVLNDRGEPVAGAKVEVWLSGKPVAAAVPWAPTDKDGRFLVERLALEEYVVSAVKEDEGYPDTGSSFYSKGMPVHRVALTAAAPEAETSIVFGPKAGVVTGRVVDSATGQPLGSGITMWRIGDDRAMLGTSVSPDYRVLIPSNVPVDIVFQDDGYESWRPGKPLRLAPDERIVLNVSLRGTWPVVDLAANPPNPGRKRKVSKIAVENSPENPRQVAKLPLELWMETATQNQDHPGEMIAQVHIKNIGTEPYRLPVGRDGDLILRPTNRGRHEFRFSLNSPYEREPFLQGQATYGSTDLLDSLLTIQPGATVRVRFKVDVGRLVPVWKTRGAVAAPFTATCVDLLYDDNPTEYLVRQPIPEAASANGTVMFLK